MPLSSWFASFVRQAVIRRPAIRSARSARRGRRHQPERLESRLALTISAIADQVVPEDRALSPVNFSIAPSNAAAANMVVTATAADPGLVPTANLVLSGTGAQRTLLITPAANAFGTTVITISAGLPGTTPETRSFTLTINPRNDAPSITSIANQTVLLSTTTGDLPFVVSDIETSPLTLQVTATSSNPALVPNRNIVVTGTRESRTVRVTPLPLQFGEATITLTVRDPGTAVSTTTFNVYVTTAALNYQLDDDDSITLSTIGDNVVTLINGTPDTRYSSVPLAKIGSITITGGSGANHIDLSGLTPGLRKLTAVSVDGGAGDDTIIGSLFGDSLSGGAGNDSIDGGDGADLLSGGADNDTVQGGLGVDRITESGDFDITLATNALQMRLPTGEVVSTDELSGVELADITGGPSANRIDARRFVAGLNGITQIIGGGGSDTIIGSEGRDLIFVFSRDDSVLAQGGDDTIYGGAGNDTLNGGAGNDQINGQLGNDLIYGSDGNDSLMGGDGADSLFGQGGNDYVFGMRDNDSVAGGAGDDALFGDIGNDVLRGNEGADTLVGSIGYDVLDGGFDYDRVLAVADATFLVTASHISCPLLGLWTIIDVDRIQIAGGSGNNAIDARTATASVALLGLEGDDTLLAGGRNDILLGGDGDDVLVTGGGQDYVDGGTGTNTQLPDLPRIAVLGDSTVATFIEPTDGQPPLEGWAQELDEYFQRDGVAVLNHAVSGRSLKSFLLEERWQAVVESRPDYVLIQFGHNDQPAYAGPTRGSDPNGEFQDILKTYIANARAAGIVPILVTPVSVRFFINGVARESVALTPYANAMREVAEETGVPLVDLNQLSFELYRSLGDQGSQYISHTPTDIAHFSPEGAYAISGLVTAALRQVAPQMTPLMVE